MAPAVLWAGLSRLPPSHRLSVKAGFSSLQHKQGRIRKGHNQAGQELRKGGGGGGKRPGLFTLMGGSRPSPLAQGAEPGWSLSRSRPGALAFLVPLRLQSPERPARPPATVAAGPFPPLVLVDPASRPRQTEADGGALKIPTRHNKGGRPRTAPSSTRPRLRIQLPVCDTHMLLFLRKAPLRDF